METKQSVERISKFTEKDIGPTEENVKQKVIVPLLELLGPKRENLEFEYHTRSGGKIDIYIKNVPPDCKVIIDTKNYNENLNDHLEQIKNYTFDENALLTALFFKKWPLAQQEANGSALDTGQIEKVIGRNIFPAMANNIKKFGHNML